MPGNNTARQNIPQGSISHPGRYPSVKLAIWNARRHKLRFRCQATWIFLKSFDTFLVEKKDQAFLLFAPKIYGNL